VHHSRWLVILLRIREVPGTYLGPQSICPDWYFSLFTSVVPDKYYKSALKQATFICYFIIFTPPFTYSFYRSTLHNLCRRKVSLKISRPVISSCSQTYLFSVIEIQKRNALVFPRSSAVKHPPLHLSRFRIDFEDIEFEMVVQFVSLLFLIFPGVEMWQLSLIPSYTVQSSRLIRGCACRNCGLERSYQVLLNLWTFSWIGCWISFVTPWNHRWEKKRQFLLVTQLAKTFHSASVTHINPSGIYEKVRH
jgi:hypothetical protein